MKQLEQIDGSTWQEFIAAPVAVLVLAKSTCPACQEWSEELKTFLAQPRETPPFPEWDQLRLGKLILDQPGLTDFKRANPWLREVDMLPYNVIYRGGERFKSFAGGGIQRLLARLQSKTD
jgi:hypothetical protein